MDKPIIKRFRFNIDEMRDTFDKFKTRIEQIEKLNAGDKLAMTEDNIFIVHHMGTFQFLHRWWFNESREKTVQYLNDNFLDYMKFIDMCVDATRSQPYENCFLELCYDNVAFQDRIRIGLKNLRDTYYKDAQNEEEHATKICKYINVLLSTMDDFRLNIIRRAYRRLINSRYTNSLDISKIDNITIDGDDLEIKLAKYDISGLNKDEKTSNIEKDKLSTKQILNSLDILVEIYPGNIDELKEHVKAVEQGDEETSSYYDSEEEEKFCKTVRERMKSKNTSFSERTKPKTSIKKKKK